MILPFFIDKTLALSSSLSLPSFSVSPVIVVLPRLSLCPSFRILSVCTTGRGRVTGRVKVSLTFALVS